ncbi:caffeoylshikimate esterase [Spatholobus suberectus]|nr:caffeoylshikimate esterase [Spatholobus suberectus]
MTHSYGFDTGWLFQKIYINFAKWAMLVFASTSSDTIATSVTWTKLPPSPFPFSSTSAVATLTTTSPPSPSTSSWGFGHIVLMFPVQLFLILEHKLDLCPQDIMNNVD